MRSQARAYLNRRNTQERADQVNITEQCVPIDVPLSPDFMQALANAYAVELMARYYGADDWSIDFGRAYCAS